MVQVAVPAIHIVVLLASEVNVCKIIFQILLS